MVVSLYSTAMNTGFKIKLSKSHRKTKKDMVFSSYTLLCSIRLHFVK